MLSYPRVTRKESRMAAMVKGSTLHDVAALAGVSPRRVSRVVNGESGFSEATRLRVVAAIDKVGYRPNLLARGTDHTSDGNRRACGPAHERSVLR